jgi:hypothetical protein
VSREELEQRQAQIAQALPALSSAWPYLTREIESRIASLTGRLITENDEQTRGRIKALRELLNLPETLQQEREGITAGLSEESDPAL